MARRSPFTPSLFIVDDIPTRQLRADFKKAAVRHSVRFTGGTPTWGPARIDVFHTQRAVEILFRKGL